MPELAHDGGASDDGRLTLRIVEGARFHDGTTITAKDVVASLRATGTGTTPLERALRLLKFETLSPRAMTVAAPRGVSLTTLRDLLAHPIAAIRRGESRCGPFVPGRQAGQATVFEAHEGHPRGRPWLDRVEIIGTDSPEQATEALVFGDVEATTVASPRSRRGASVTNRGWGTVFAIPGDSFRGRSRAAARRRVAALMRGARFGAHLDTTVAAVDGFLPSALLARADKGARVEAGLAVDDLTIVYPAERSDLADLARAVRDTLRGDVQGVARVNPVAGLDLSRAAGASPNWDLALVEVEWTALDTAQGVLEASSRLPVPSLRPEEALRGPLDRWFAARREQAEVIPVVHVARPVFHKASWHLAVGSGSAGGLASSWRRP